MWEPHARCLLEFGIPKLGFCGDLGIVGAFALTERLPALAFSRGEGLLQHRHVLAHPCKVIVERFGTGEFELRCGCTDDGDAGPLIAVKAVAADVVRMPTSIHQEAHWLVGEARDVSNHAFGDAGDVA